MIDLFPKPADSRGFVHGRIIGAVKAIYRRGRSAGPGGIGTLVRPVPTMGRGERIEAARLAAVAARPCPPDLGGCSSGLIHVGGGTCIRPGIDCIDTLQVRRTTGIRGTVERLIPGGATGYEVRLPSDRGFTGTAEAVAGAFGMPAIVPEAVQQQRLVCPSGMVLGRDDLCYPKQVLRRDSRFRKHRPGVRPILTGGQRAAIRKAKVAVNTAREAISGFGITVAKKKGK